MTSRIVAVIMATVLFFCSATKVFAYQTPSAQSYDFAVTSFKIISDPPIREENDFITQVTYTYYAINQGYWYDPPDEWIECEKCGGSGEMKCSVCDGEGGNNGAKKIYCKAPGHPRCQESCNGFDYKCKVCGFIQTSDYGTPNYCDHESTPGTQIKHRKCTCIVEKIDGEGEWKECGACGGMGSKLCSYCDGSGGHLQDMPPVWIPPSRPSAGYTQIDFLIDGAVQTYATKNIIITIDGESADTSPNGSGWSVWGSVTMDVTLNACENIGNKTAEARINWDYRNRETNSQNNSLSLNMTVIPATNLTVEHIPPNAPYRTDTDVITSYIIHNEDNIGALNIKPKHGLTAEFNAVDTSTGNIVATVTKTNIIIPAHGTNLVYFQWHVPKEYSKKQIRLICKINTTKVPGSVGVPGVNEMDYSDNTATSINEVLNGAISDTPDTKLVLSTPSEFNRSAQLPTNDNMGNLTNTSWEEWQWENNDYSKKSNSASLSASASLTIDTAGGWTSVTDGKPTTRSGYGINADVLCKYNATTPGMVTNVQRCYSLFSDFNYSSSYGSCKTLEPVTKASGEIKYNFYKSNYSFEKHRVHYTSVWIPDGKYNVSFVVSDYWTPAGMISGYTTDFIYINGSMYDDWNTVRGKTYEGGR